MRPSIALLSTVAVLAALTTEAAQPPAAAEKPDAGRPQADERRRDAAERLQKGQRELLELEAKWLEELVAAKGKVVEGEVRLRAVELDIARHTERRPAAESSAALRQLAEERDNLRANLAQIERLAKPAEAARLSKETQDKLAAVDAKIAQVKRQLIDQEEKEWVSGLQKLFADEVAARKQLVRFQEEARALERRHDHARADAYRALDQQAQRVRDLDAGPGARPADGPDAKLERVLRELEELRRELKRKE